MGAIQTETMEEMAIWQEVYANAKLQNFDSILGYNFKWETIFDACGSESNDLRVVFGVIQYTSSNNFALHMILTNPYSENKNLENGKVFLDFSKPCPKMCGWLTTGVGGSAEDD